jgi:hypothetical protein
MNKRIADNRPPTVVLLNAKTHRTQGVVRIALSLAVSRLTVLVPSLSGVWSVVGGRRSYKEHAV